MPRALRLRTEAAVSAADTALSLIPLNFNAHGSDSDRIGGGGAKGGPSINSATTAVAPDCKFELEGF